MQTKIRKTEEVNVQEERYDEGDGYSENDESDYKEEAMRTLILIMLLVAVT